MKREQRYGVKSLQAQFHNEDACLDYIFDTLHSRTCSCGGTYKRITGRKQFQCSRCRFQIAPTSGTIFHKSDTPLTLWFKAILTFSNAKSGVSSKYLERELEVTYKTAWRILNLIRKALKQGDDKLKGTVELDTGYFGGVYKSGRYSKNQKAAMDAKSVIMGAVERKGKIRLAVVPDATSYTQGKFLTENVDKENTRLMMDNTNHLNKVAMDFDRHVVNHGKGEFVREDVYVNTMESFWAHVKRSVKRTRKVVSKKHLRAYLDGFVWHYNNRHSDRERFSSLLGMILHGAV